MEKNKLERVKRIELSYSAWEAAALPLSYTRFFVACLLNYSWGGVKRGYDVGGYWFYVV